MPLGGMVSTAAPFVPESRDLDLLAEASRGCQGCDLYKRATQTVFGEGAPRASLVVVGEQPGDQEDRAGRPFVGPAGRLLDEALAQAGIDRERAYVTNAVKHFKWEERGKRRIHNKPNRTEIRACRPWLTAELRAIRPDVIVLLGATAVASLLGPDARVTQIRGQLLESEWAHRVLATVHPSSIIRILDPDQRHAAFDAFVADLRTAAQAIEAAAESIPGQTRPGHAA
jgi:uracil-DNA glycosylase family protein